MRKESSIIHIMQLCPLVVLSSIGKDIRGSRIGGSFGKFQSTKKCCAICIFDMPQNSIWANVDFSIHAVKMQYGHGMGTDREG